MVRPVFKRCAVCAFALMAALSTAKAQDVWDGGFPNADVSVGSNWAGRVVPPGYTAGTDILEFNDSSSSDMKINVPSVNFIGIELDDYGSGVSANIFGSNALTIGVNGITLAPIDGDSINLSVAAPLTLSSNQNWTGGTNASIDVTGTVSGPGVTLSLIGGSGDYYEFDSGSNSFTGGLNVSGEGTVLIAGATGTPFGTGPLSLGDGVTLSSGSASPIALSNAVTFGDSTSTDGSVVMVGNNSSYGPSPSSFTFNGNATFKVNGTDSSDSEVDLEPNTTLILNDTLTGGTTGVCLDFGTPTSIDYPANFNSVVILRGDFGTNISRMDLEDSISVVLDGTPATQLTNLPLIGTSSGTYLGLGESYIGNVASFLTSPQISQANFVGTLGFDNTTGGTSTFGDAVDLTGFTNSGFVGLGSASSAIITGFITPPGGLALKSGTSYLFGGGGGSLTVTSALTDSQWNNGDGYTNESNTLTLSPGNGPLTLTLNGYLDYTGGTNIDGAVLIFDTTVPTTGTIALGEISSPGYVGVTSNSQFVPDGSGGAGTHPEDFISLIAGGSNGVVGFDGGMIVSDTTVPIDLSELPGIYLGTSTSVTYSGAIIPYNGTFQFSGVKGGQVTVTSNSLTGSNSLEVGLPQPIESFGSVSEVILPGENSYTGGTTLNSGYLYVGTLNSLGYVGGLTIAGPTTGNANTVGLAPYNADVGLDTAIDVESNNTHLNYATSPYMLTLSGNITGNVGTGFYVDGPVTLGGDNSSFYGGFTVNGTTLNFSTDSAVGGASFIQAFSGSTVNFSGPGTSLYINQLNLQGAAANFSGSMPVIDNLSMSMGSQITFAASSSPEIRYMDSDDPNSGNVINLGANTALSFAFYADPDYHGTFTGPGSSSITVTGGEMNFMGSSTGFAGTVNVGANGTVIASNDNALGTGSVTVLNYGVLGTNTGVTLTNPLSLQDGGTLAGFGTFSPGSMVTIQNASQLIPGVATLTNGGVPPSVPLVGQLNFGSNTPLTFAGGGTLVISMEDANGAAGTGYSTVNAAGGLTVTASSMSLFNINLLSYTPGMTTLSAPANFDSSLYYSWTLVSSSSPITGFNASAFNLDTSGFQTSLGTGEFYLSVSGDDLMLNFTPVPEPSTWALIGVGAVGVCAVGMRRSRRSRTA